MLNRGPVLTGSKPAAPSATKEFSQGLVKRRERTVGGVSFLVHSVFSLKKRKERKKKSSVVAPPTRIRSVHFLMLPNLVTLFQVTL